MVRGKPELEVWGFYWVQANLNLFHTFNVYKSNLKTYLFKLAFNIS